ncbi:MAG: XRE family transcriptional regulator [Pseudomonadota bacterium]
MANGDGRGAIELGLFLPANRDDPLRNFSTILGERLRRLMAREGISLDKLSDFLGICRNSLSRIYDGEVVPTISLIWKIANVFGVPFGSLISSRERRGTFVLRPSDTAVLSSSDGQFTSRALFPYNSARLVEFYELRIASGHKEDAVAHVPGTVECLVVTRGTVEISSGKEQPQTLRKGDVIIFEADVPHSYANRGKNEAVLYLVMSYSRLDDETEPAR